MKIGYIRSLEIKEEIHQQTTTLLTHGCHHIITEIGPSTTVTRLVEQLHTNNTLVVTRLAILGLSISELLQFLNKLVEKKISFWSIEENIQTNEEIIEKWIAALAQFSRQIQQTRQKIGLATARSRGKLGGRPLLLDGKKKNMLNTLIQDNRYSIPDICELLNISRATLYRYLKRDKQ